MLNQVIAVAVGGACGSVLRFLVSTGVYQWLGRGFPYGTLAVNVMGSFLMGLLVEVLILQRVAMTVEYRAAILVGLFGSFTTFSTFSLETVYLIEQGSFGKAALNISVSIAACLIAVWVGLLGGRLLMLYSGGVIRSMGWAFPYAMATINALGALLIGLVASLIVEKIALAPEYRAAVMIIGAGAFVTFSGLYLILYLIEDEHPLDLNVNWMLSIFLSNAIFCGLALWSGYWIGKKL
ncbi:MAG: fluoride efflux transporter CrcB [Gammaproteobacteria bacterium HGW-Gammaproteobacteria-10]|nr:MAG: fluoride efflux transporter CrcB [Gammaproteobacteria bacterium HGW-Gammaproteobacteria-10]